MNIEKVSNAIYVGEIILGTKPYNSEKFTFYDSALEFNYSESFPKNLINKHVSMAYIFVVNGNIYKIGQSSGTGGIKACMGFYLKAGLDIPGPNRFAINWLIREELKKKHKIEIYMIYMEPIKVSVPGLTQFKEIIVPISAKGIEDNCLQEYKSQHEDFPCWNFQESHTKIPSEISLAFAQYKINRQSKNKSTEEGK